MLREQSFRSNFPTREFFWEKHFLKNWSNCTKIKNWKQRKFETLEPKIKLHFPKLKLFEARKILKQRATVAAALNVLSASLNRDSAITPFHFSQIPGMTALTKPSVLVTYALVYRKQDPNVPHGLCLFLSSTLKTTNVLSQMRLDSIKSHYCLLNLITPITLSIWLSQGSCSTFILLAAVLLF